MNHLFGLPPGQEVKLRPGSTANARFSLSVAVGVYAPRAFTTRGGPAHGVRRGGKKCRDGRIQEDDEGRRARTASRWLSSWLRGNGGKSLEPPRGC